MAAFALFDALQGFRLAARGGEPRRNPEPPVAAAPAAVPDIAAIVRAEVAKAEASLEARLRLEHETALAAERQSHAAEVEAMLRHFGESAGETIAARVGEMEDRIGELAAALGRAHPRLLPQRRIAETLDRQPCPPRPRGAARPRGRAHRGARAAVAVRDAERGTRRPRRQRRTSSKRRVSTWSSPLTAISSRPGSAEWSSALSEILS